MSYRKEPRRWNRDYGPSSARETDRAVCAVLDYAEGDPMIDSETFRPRRPMDNVLVPLALLIGAAGLLAAVAMLFVAPLYFFGLVSANLAAEIGCFAFLVVDGYLVFCICAPKWVK